MIGSSALLVSVWEILVKTVNDLLMLFISGPNGPKRLLSYEDFDDIPSKFGLQMSNDARILPD